jgi:hypothetical protein
LAQGVALLFALFAPVRVAIAQNGPPLEPRLEISLTGDLARGQAGDPMVRAVDLLGDGRWIATLQEGLPVRLSYRLELWKSKSVWFDQLQRLVEWDVVVRWEPVLLEFSVRTITGSGMRERRYSTREALATALGARYRIALRPTTAGTHYYVGSLAISTLSDSDIQELERFLQGEGDEGQPGGADAGGVLGRRVTHLLLRLAGLPRLRLEARSPELAGPE